MDDQEKVALSSSKIKTSTATEMDKLIVKKDYYSKIIQKPSGSEIIYVDKNKKHIFNIRKEIFFDPVALLAKKAIACFQPGGFSAKKDHVDLFLIKKLCKILKIENSFSGCKIKRSDLYLVFEGKDNIKERKILKDITTVLGIKYNKQKKFNPDYYFEILNDIFKSWHGGMIIEEPQNERLRATVKLNGKSVRIEDKIYVIATKEDNLAIAKKLIEPLFKEKDLTVEVISNFWKNGHACLQRNGDEDSKELEVKSGKKCPAVTINNVALDFTNVPLSQCHNFNFGIPAY